MSSEAAPADQDAQDAQEDSSSGGESNVAIFAALAANLGIAVTKFLAFLLTRSSSMLAESIHSLADSGNQLLLLLGGKRASRTPTPEHPFGYGQQRYVYGFVVSIVLFSLGGLFALYEAYTKFVEPEAIEGRWWWVPLAVLAVAVVMEGSSLRTAKKQADGQRGNRSYAQFIRTAKGPELPVVLLEDSAAITGLVFAGFGVVMTLVTGDGRWDALGTALIGALLVLVAGVLAVEMNSLLIGESATRADQQAIERALVGGGVDRIIHMKTMHLGPEELLVAAKIAVGPRDRASEVADAIDAAEKRVRDAVPIARMIYLEPDIDRGAGTGGGSDAGRG